MSSRSRSVGLLLGLCAGDRNGGPQRMALRVAEAFAECEAFGTLDSCLSCLLRSYLAWYGDARFAGPSEYDAAYDTGVVFKEVLQKVSSRVDAEDSDEMLLKAAHRAANESFERRQSAGVSPAHRSVVLAMQPGIALSWLAAAAVAEARLTHRHCEALATAAAVALLARQLLSGEGIPAACRRCLPYLHDFDAPETLRVLRRFAAADTEGVGDAPPQPTHREGFSPLVLESALCFLVSARSFEDALHDSLEFAGPDNFCPVLVGSLGGALFGCDVDLESLAEPDVPDVPGPGPGAGVTWRTLNHEHFLPAEHRKRIGRVAKVYAELNGDRIDG